MKKILLLLALCLYIGTQAQRTIEHKTTGIKISSAGINYLNNEIKYTIEIPKAYIDSGIKFFPLLQGQLKFKDGEFIYSDFITIGNMYEIMQVAKVEQSDVGLTGVEIQQNFSIAIIYMTNIFNLNLNDWEVK